VATRGERQAMCAKLLRMRSLRLFFAWNSLREHDRPLFPSLYVYPLLSLSFSVSLSLLRVRGKANSLPCHWTRWPSDPVVRFFRTRCAPRPRPSFGVTSLFLFFLLLLFRPRATIAELSRREKREHPSLEIH